MKSVRRNRGAKLGQHFLTGLWAARKLTEAVDVMRDETILEVGPGKGALTGELLSTGAKVVAVEKDTALIGELSRTFAGEIKADKLCLLEDDIRNFDPEKIGLTKYAVAANIPYYITGEIIRQFLTAHIQPRAMALLIQKEVADRITCLPAGRSRRGKESILSLSVKAYGTPKIVAKVSRGNFSPPPNVDSAILAVTNISRDFFADINEEIFFKVVRAGFASKRKFLANNLAVAFEKDAVLHAFDVCGLGAKARAEDVPLETWKCLTSKLEARS